MKTTGLTIQEAIQSGLPFKRPFYISYMSKELSGGGKELQMLFTPSDILANDWQIKVPEVTITREKLAEAWDKTLTGALRIEPHNNSFSFDYFCKELGL